ncbi:hypothetical protein [Micromonospora sp. NPDC126480]|uniref:hypothetical protein n=1 Tax=Micromonospora sp. NPDC126480 TaxID=3155312 RepID=UPI00331B2FE6
MLTRGPRRTVLALLLAALLAVAAAPAVSWADPPGAECPPGQTNCDVWDDDPGTPGGGGGPGGGDGGGNGGGGGGKCQWNGRVIPCYDEDLGWFNNSNGCYYKLAEPQQEAPPGQQWYVLTCNGGDLGSQHMELLDAPPPGYGAPPDPEELARRALASIDLLPPNVAVAPRKRVGPGLVGLPVWMWASPDRPGEPRRYFGPQHADASDRGLTVYIEAKVDRVVWDMGNGDKVTCPGPGTPYRSDNSLAGKPSPDCGYDDGYPRAGTYRVQATTFWTVNWRGGGESGVIPVTRTSNTVTIQINELQVVTQ